MEIKVILNRSDLSEEISGLNDFIREQNLKGIITKVEEIEAPKGTMGFGDLMPIITLILGSSVVTAGVKGLFDLVKNYFEMRKQRELTNAEIERTKLEQYNIDFVFETNEGKKVNLKFNSFSDEERKQFLQTVDSVLKS